MKFGFFLIEERNSVLTFEENEEIFKRHSLCDSVTELAVRLMFIGLPLKTPSTVIVNLKENLSSVFNLSFCKRCRRFCDPRTISFSKADG